MSAFDGAHAVTTPLVEMDEWVDALHRVEIWILEVGASFWRPVRLASPASAVVRGLMTAHFRAARCLTAKADCEGCTVSEGCDYARVVGVERVAGEGRGSDVHPYWLQGLPVDRAIAAGTELTARLSVLAVERAQVPRLNLGLRSALRTLGEEADAPRVAAPRLSATRTDHVTPWQAADPARAWWVAFHTPALVTPPRRPADLPPSPSVPWLSPLLLAGVRRVREIAWATGVDLPKVRLPDLRAIEVVTSSVAPWTGSTFSRRQGKRIKLEHGLVGHAILRGPTLPDIGRLLRVLALTGVGKMTTMGFGQLVVRPIG